MYLFFIMIESKTYVKYCICVIRKRLIYLAVKQFTCCTKIGRIMNKNTVHKSAQLQVCVFAIILYACKICSNFGFNIVKTYFLPLNTLMTQDIHDQQHNLGPEGRRRTGDHCTWMVLFSALTQRLS